MTTIELGTWQTRAGYVGDVACTRVLRSVALPDAPTVTDFMSVMLAKSHSKRLNEEEEGEPHEPQVGEDDVIQLWSLRSFQSHSETHLNYLRHLKNTVLGCSDLSDPLALVVPEAWHERLDVVGGIFELILEDGGITNSLYCARPSVCWTLASGKASAVVLDVGHSHTTVTGVLDGYALRHTFDEVLVGGAAVTAQFAALAEPALSAFVEQQFPTLASCLQKNACLTEDYAADIKHVFGFVNGTSGTGNGTGGTGAAAAVKNGNGAANPQHHQQQLRAPDGSTLSFSAEECSSPFEMLFSRDPALSELNVADMVVRCKRRADPEWQVRTVHHILAGGGSRASGFCERLLSEVKEKDAAYFRYERDNAFLTARSAAGAWVGASMAAASSSFDPLWVTRAEWEEEGESVLYRKLFY